MNWFKNILVQPLYFFAEWLCVIYAVENAVSVHSVGLYLSTWSTVQRLIHSRVSLVFNSKFASKLRIFLKSGNTPSGLSIYIKFRQRKRQFQFQLGSATLVDSGYRRETWHFYADHLHCNHFRKMQRKRGWLLGKKRQAFFGLTWIFQNISYKDRGWNPTPPTVFAIY